MKILDRYVVGELTGPFIFGTSTFTILFLSVDALMRAARLVVDEGHHRAIQFILANLPAVLAYAFPMSALLACLMAFGRMSADSEIVAMKAGGISFYRLALPGLVMTMLLALAALYLTDQVVPQANYQAHSILLNQLGKETDQMLLRNFKIQEVSPDGTDRVVFAREFKPEEGLLKTLTVIFYRQPPHQETKRVRVLYADDAKWSEENGWTMYRVRVQDLNDDESVKADSYSDRMALPLTQTPQEMASRPRGRDEMTRPQLLIKARVEKQLHPEGVNRKANSYLVEYYSRVALPFSCFVFGLFGIPLGLQPHRTSKSIGLGLSIVFIFIYYLLMTISHSLGENGILTPIVASWVPNTVFGGVGLALLVKAGEV